MRPNICHDFRTSEQAELVPARGLSEFRRVLRKDGTVSICVISTPDRAPMWGNLAEVLSRFLPELREVPAPSTAISSTRAASPTSWLLVSTVRRRGGIRPFRTITSPDPGADGGMSGFCPRHNHSA
jgi:hypothetical protein